MMSKLSMIRGYKSLPGDIVHTHDEDSQGRPALYVAREDHWGLWVCLQTGAVEDDSTMPDEPPASAYGPAKRFAARVQRARTA